MTSWDAQVRTAAGSRAAEGEEAAGRETLDPITHTHVVINPFVALLHLTYSNRKHKDEIFIFCVKTSVNNRYFILKLGSKNFILKVVIYLCREYMGFVVLLGTFLLFISFFSG